MLNAVTRKRVAKSNMLEVATHLAARRAALKPDGLAASTRSKYASSDEYFYEFCQHLGLDFHHFGQAEATGGYSIAVEDDLLELFAIFVC